MPPLPRGLCSYCNTDVPLRKDNLAREHKDPRHPLHKIGQVDRVPVCPGSGKLAATPDTGGVEGPYKVEDGNTVTGPTIHGLHMSTDAQGVVDSLNAAWRLGHKAGASGSGEAALLRVAEHAENFDFAAVNEGEALLEVAALARRLATQNPASGSDGLRARVEKVLELVEDYGRKLDKGGGEHRMYLRQFIQKELPHKLAAALADGGMGDE